MLVERFEQKEKEEFSRIVNILLAENCIYQYKKQRHFEKKEYNQDYIFINEHWDCFEEYLSYANWTLKKDKTSYMGMIYISNDREDCHAKYQLTMLETQFLLILRNYYEEKHMELDGSLSIQISLQDVLHLLIDVFALTSSKPAQLQIHQALLTLQKLNVIQKYKNGEEEYIWIMPYITCVLSLERVDKILQLIQEEGDEDEIEEDVVD